MRLSILSVVALAALVVTSCVPQKKYDELQNRFNSVYAENQGCQTELAASKTRVQSLEDMLNAERSNLASMQAALTECLAGSKQGGVNISKLVDEINASNKYIKHLTEINRKNDSLNMVLTNNLTRSLSREEMRDVDVQVLKGVVYISLSDNMLYKSGSYEISPAANETLAKIAKIIKDYKDYDVLIEGNTDNVPIRRDRKSTRLNSSHVAISYAVF